MRVNELRIGNLLRDKVSKTELKVIELTEKDIITYVIDRSLFPLKNGWGIEPILLTEEWLLNFGFVPNGFSMVKGEFDVEIWLESEIGHTFKWNDFVISISLKYVHQLQNLYFALTNEELIINK